jgi:hypothetical protein
MSAPPRSLRSALLASAVGLVLGALLNAESVVARAERLEHGAGRELSTALAAPVAALSRALWLDRPHAALRDLSRALTEGEARTVMARLAPPGAAPPPIVDAADVGSDDALEGDEGDGISDISEPETDAEVEPAVVALALEPLPGRERRAVSPQAPLAVWALGDSLLTLPAFALQQQLYATGAAWVDHDSRHSTGLARPDNFDWPARFEEKLTEGRPEVVIFMFGANDGTAMVRDSPYKFLPLEAKDWAVPGGDWAAEYARRVGALMDRALSVGAEVLWLGIPPVRDPVREQHSALLNDLFRQEADAREGVTFLDAHAMFDDGAGGYTSALEGIDGERVPVRAGDGVHLNEAGAERLAEHVTALIGEAWELPSRPIREQ